MVKIKGWKKELELQTERWRRDIRSLNGDMNIFSNFLQKKYGSAYMSEGFHHQKSDKKLAKKLYFRTLSIMRRYVTIINKAHRFSASLREETAYEPGSMWQAWSNDLELLARIVYPRSIYKNSTVILHKMMRRVRE